MQTIIGNRAGNLTIADNPSLTSLSGLSSLTSVGSDLIIQNNPELTSLAGLTGLTRIGDNLQVTDNAKLTNLAGLGNVTSVGYNLVIQNNPELTSLAGLTNLTRIGNNLQINSNAKLTNLAGLTSLASVEFDLVIQNNPELTSLTGLTSLTRIANSLEIIGNAKLTNLVGLGNVTSLRYNLLIQNNSELTSLAGLTGLTRIGNILQVTDNAKLINLAGLGNVTSVGYNLVIQNNPELTNLAGLGNVTTVGNNLLIGNNPVLSSLAALSALTQTGNDLQINNNAQLTSLSGLSSLTRVGARLIISGNPVLSSLSSLNSSLDVIGLLQIVNNPQLATCAFVPICVKLANSPERVSISGNATGCSSTAEVQNICTNPLAITTPPPSGSTVCVGATVTASVSATGNVSSYQWYKGTSALPSQTTATLRLTNVQPADAGAYVVVVSNSVSSLTSTAFNLTVNALPTVSLSNNGPITCARPVVALTATTTPTGGRYRFTGLGANENTTSNQIFVITPDQYRVVYTSPQGCTASATSFVESNTALPTVSISPTSATLSCASPTASLSATGTGSLRWSTGETTSPIAVTTAGTYSVTLTGINGCTATTSTTVSSDTTPPTVSITPGSATLTCSAPTAVLTATSSVTALRWSTNATTSSISVGTGGTYSVTATGPNGCTSVSNSVTVDADTSVPTNVSLTSGTLSCAQTSVTLTATPNGLSYVFSAGATPLGSTNQAVVSTPGLYSVTVVSGNGCSSVASVSVSQDNSAPSASLVSSGTLSCAVTSVTLTANPGGLSYIFSAGATQPGSSNQAVVSTAGLYSVTVVAGNGCSAVAQTVVASSTALVSVTLPATTTATQGVAFSQAFTAGGGVSPYGFSLVSGNLPTGLSLTTTGVLSGTPTQTGSFTLTVGATDANGCSGVSPAYMLTVSEPIFVGTLRLVAPVYNCQSGAITFRTVGGSGSGVEYRAIGVTDWTTNPNQTVDLPVRQDANAQPLTLQARQNGVMVSYTFDFRLFCNSAVPNQPPVFTQPPAQTATVGQPFAYRIPDETFRDLNGTAVNVMATNLPAGLSYSPDTRVISGTPSAVGSYTVMLSVSDPLSLSASGGLVIQVNPVVQPPVSTTVNQAPVFNGPLAAQSGTVGSGFTYTLPAGVFTDPNAGDVLTYAAVGLPAGLQFTASSQSISGQPTTAGTYSVSLTATDQGGLSVSGTLTIIISTSATPPPTGAQPLAVIQPLYDCTTGAITFRTTGGDGSPIYFSSVGIVASSTQTSYVLEAPIRQDANSQPLLIKATQSGVTTSYLFDFRLYCTGTVVTNPPVFNGPLPTQTGQVGVSFNYQLPATSFTAPNGGALNYSVTGLPAGLGFTAGTNLISGLPTQAGSVTATITASDPLGQSSQGALVFVIAPAPTNPPVGGQPLALLVPLYDCGTGSFTFQTAGGDGTVIEYFAVGITGPTAVAGPYTVLPASDAQPFTLKARQSGVEVTYTWDFKAVCPGRSRVGVVEPGGLLVVTVLGNPVLGDQVEVQVSGAQGQPLRYELMDVSGQVVSERQVDLAGVVDQQRLWVANRRSGLLLLRVSTPTQNQTVKVLKP